MPAYKPLLKEVILAVDTLARQLGRRPVGWSVEVKSTPTGDEIFHPTPARFAELVLAMLQVTQVLTRTTLLSFDERILQQARVAEADLRLCLLRETPFSARQLFEPLGFIPSVFGPDFQLLSASLVRELLDTYPGLELVPWTVNTPADLQRLADWPLAGITTDYPDRLLAVLPPRRL